MKELHIFVEDDVYNFLDFYRRAVSELTKTEEHSMEDFIMLLSSLGMTSLGKALMPETEEEMREITLSLLSGTIEKTKFMQKIYELTRTQREKRLGYTMESKNPTP